MAMKRKFADDSDDASSPNNAKQLKLIPWPNYQPDEDSCMLKPNQYHTVTIGFLAQRLQVRILHPARRVTLVAYPTFDLYPLPFFGPNGNVDPNSHSFAHYAAQQPPSPLLAFSSLRARSFTMVRVARRYQN
ncbi:hypothetical protein B0H12DRAFT_1234063 [Mycena haematopus]|nr:hypothetical protein B0H12DRAFT_1234063 [Mycena haematopus]